MAPNLHQARLNALSNTIVFGSDRLQLAAAKDASAPLTQTPVDSSASYWEWSSEADPALFSSTRMIERMQQSRQQQASEPADAVPLPSLDANHDNYWFEPRFAAERKYDQPEAPRQAPQYWDEATHTRGTNCDMYWRW